MKNFDIIYDPHSINEKKQRFESYVLEDNKKNRLINRLVGIGFVLGFILILADFWWICHQSVITSSFAVSLAAVALFIWLFLLSNWLIFGRKEESVEDYFGADMKYHFAIQNKSILEMLLNPVTPAEYSTLAPAARKYELTLVLVDKDSCVTQHSIKFFAKEIVKQGIDKGAVDLDKNIIYVPYHPGSKPN